MRSGSIRAVKSVKDSCIGVATFIPTVSETTLLQKADQALYASKEQGRNRVTHSIDLNEKLL
jgi:diguanylate cyclase